MPSCDGIDSSQFEHNILYCPASNTIFSDDVTAVVDYGSKLCCAVGAGHVLGVQFHPEKSQREGLALLTGFFRL